MAIVRWGVASTVKIKWARTFLAFPGTAQWCAIEHLPAGLNLRLICPLFCGHWTPCFLVGRLDEGVAGCARPSKLLLKVNLLIRDLFLVLGVPQQYIVDAGHQ